MEYNFTFREKDKGFQVILSYKVLFNETIIANSRRM